MKLNGMNRTAGRFKLVVISVLIVLSVLLLAACGGDATATTQPTLAATAIPTSAPTSSPTATTEPTSVPVPDPTAAPTARPTSEPTPAPTADPSIAIKAEVANAVRQFGEALSTADAELFASLFLHDKISIISSSAPSRLNGWTAVEASFNGLFSLPPGSVSLLPRQSRIDLIGDDTAIWTGHFILNVRAPEQAPQTVEGRFTSVLQYADGGWLIVHMHSSLLPQ